MMYFGIIHQVAVPSRITGLDVCVEGLEKDHFDGHV